LSGGTFVIDMTSITNTDMSGNMADKLVGHLKSDDFFGVATYPTSTLVITKVEGAENGQYKVTADLSIKGKTHPVTFVTKNEGDTFMADIKVDRTLYDVRYGSGKFFEGLGDKMIYDNFELSVTLVKA
jgi:polyisoprenoid-binding protein YceI